jgi:cob(I)alamin adenosyltransferase
MVRLTRIYTRGGDRGETSLGDGTRVAKHDLRVAAFGTIDEANAVIGLARLHADPGADAMLADLCRPGDDPDEANALRIQPTQVERLENEIDGLNASLKPLDSFILPGGRPAAAYLHQARTVVRRAERLTTELASREPVNPAATRYLNRLSDHLFVLGRFLNDKGAADVLWVPGANR